MFVCLGNICRSPLAHGVLEELARKADLADRLEVASSGVGAWHIGEKPDIRMRRTAQRYGISLDSQRAQQISSSDLAYYDHIYVMDRGVEREVLLMDPQGGFDDKVHLFSDSDPDLRTFEVPDPYFDGSFELVYTIVDRTCRVIFDSLVNRYNLVPAA